MNFAIKSQITLLLEKGLLDSAEILSSFLASSTPQTSEHFREALELHGDSIFVKQEYKRALGIYCQALQHKKQIKPYKTNKSIIESKTEAQIKYKECQCRMLLKDPASALRELEVIPQALRDVKVNTLLGKLYKSSGLRRHAVVSYKEALHQMPLAIELIEELLSLSVPANEILAMLQDIRGKNAAYASVLNEEWLSNVVTAMGSRYNEEFSEIESIYKTCLHQFPRNPYLLGCYARAAVDCERNDEALVIYRQIRAVDECIITGMDIMGHLLFQKEEITSLNKLTSDLLAVDPRHAVPWVVASMFSELKGDQEKAVLFVDKAIQCDPKHAFSFRLKGHLLLTRQRPDQAVIAFFQASSLEKDVGTLSGLVQAHMALHKSSDAIAAAKDALLLHPRSSTAMFLYASVLAMTRDGQKEAVRILKKLLSQSPTHTSAVTSLVMLLSSQGKHEEAITCLNTALEIKPCPQLRIQLGKLLSKLGMHEDALAALNEAVTHSINSTDLTEATQELERVERILKGEEVSQDEDLSAGRQLTAS